MGEDRFFGDLPRWQRPFAWAWTIVYSLFGIALVAFLVLGALAALFGWGGEPESDGNDASPKTISIETPTTTTARVTTSAAKVTPPTADPRVGRPVFTEFQILSYYDDELATVCAAEFNNDMAACYDAYERGTDNFDAKIIAALEAHTEAVFGSDAYTASQYGCHDDGRCLDDYGEWCWESEAEYIEGFGVACPGTAQSIYDDLAEDFYQDQIEDERYP